MFFHSGFFSYTAAGIARPLHPFRPRSGGKVRVLIKADRLRVDRQLPDAVMPHGTFQHLPAKTHAAFVCRKEQHLQPLAVSRALFPQLHFSVSLYLRFFHEVILYRERTEIGRGQVKKPAIFPSGRIYRSTQ